MSIGERALSEIRNVSKDVESQLAPLVAKRQSRSREIAGAHRRSVQELKELGRDLRAQPSAVPELGGVGDLRTATRGSGVSIGGEYDFSSRRFSTGGIPTIGGEYDFSSKSLNAPQSLVVPVMPPLQTKSAFQKAFEASQYTRAADRDPENLQLDERLGLGEGERTRSLSNQSQPVQLTIEDSLQKLRASGTAAAAKLTHATASSSGAGFDFAFEFAPALGGSNTIGSHLKIDGLPTPRLPEQNKQQPLGGESSVAESMLRGKRAAFQQRQSQ